MQEAGGIIDKTTGIVKPLTNQQGQPIAFNEKPPVGYERAPDGKTLQFIKDSPADPETKLGAMGAREAVQVNRINAGWRKSGNE